MDFYDVLFAKKLNGGGGGGSSFVFTGAEGKLWGGMAKALVDGTYVSGNVTYTTAFANEWQEILDTGLSNIKGFCAWVRDAQYLQGAQQCNEYMIFSVNDDETNTLDYAALCVPTSNNGTPTGKVMTNLSQGTNYDSAGLNGAIQINGGKIEYKGRYNKNATFQIFPTNKVIEWIAW